MRRTLCLLLLTAPLAASESARPVRLVGDPHTAHLLIARENGTVTTVNVADGDISATHRVAAALSDFVQLPSGDRFLALDPTTNEVSLLKQQDSGFDKIAAVRSAGPTRVAVTPSGAIAAVSRQWSSAVDLFHTDTLESIRSVELPFPPRELTAVNEDTFVVAGAFGGELAVLRSDGAVRVHVLTAHNLRGLLVSGDSLFVSHQILSRLGRTEFADVHWGTLMQNVVSRVRLASLTAAELQTEKIALGDVGKGSADPGRMALLADGRLAVLLCGVDEVLISQVPSAGRGFQFATGSRFTTGARPVDICPGPSGSLLVAGSVDHSVQHISEQGETSVLIAGAIPETAVARGERAFFSARLSHDGWMSCNSCHSLGHTIGLQADTLGDDTFGNPKLIPSLLGTGDAGPWGWLGNFETLDAQVAKSVRTTMHGETNPETVSDIVAFLKTLSPPPRRSGVHTNDAVLRGRKLFAKLDCRQCHQPPVFTSADTYDVGFRDESNVSRFNPPSLRGVAYRSRFFHDGRDGSLDAALKRHLSALKKQVTRTERQSLRAYLLSL